MSLTDEEASGGPAEQSDWPQWAVEAMAALTYGAGGDPLGLRNVSWADLDARIDSSREAELAERFSELVGAVTATEAEIASLSARRARQLEEARELSEAFEKITRPADAQGWSPAEAARRVLVSELAAALRLPERTAENLVAESHILTSDLQRTLSALSAGEISYRHAQRIIDHASSLPVEARAAFEDAVLPAARTMPVAKFADVARKLRERTHPETIDQRRSKAVSDRGVWLQNERDGMASLTLQTSAADAHAAFSRVCDLASALQTADEARTLTQIRADVLRDLLIDGVTADGLGAGVRAEVQITIPVLTLLGHDDEPPTLEGYGPIDLETAKQLASNAPGFTRILTHPETGCVLSVSSDRYTPSQALRRWLRVRDETCRFPGCRRSAARCDLDHTVDWQYGGGTKPANLAHLCPLHHAMKHNTAWSVTQRSDGALDWTSPTRRRYRTGPATRMGPSPVSFVEGASRASPDAEAPPF